uniref:rRNA N-glycosylase n=1 Tax=Hordeum vulgare subsp. vulgare TaxID=112509 RepID=M0VIW3_HORVV
MKNLREQLTFARHERLDRPLLAKFRPDNPARWMHVKLVSDNHEATLAIRDDTVYLIGFQARNGTWYEFSSSKPSLHLPPQKKESSLHLIEGSTFLDCGVTYGDLLGGAMNLVNMRLGHLQVNLGKLFAIEAVRLLSEYSGGGLTDNHKKALAGLILIICESARMISHFDTVINGWPRAGGKSISRQQVHYVWNWGNMSRFLTGRSRSLQDEERLRQSCGITTEELALGIVHLLLNSPQPPYPTAAGQAATAGRLWRRRAFGPWESPADTTVYCEPRRTRPPAAAKVVICEPWRTRPPPAAEAEAIVWDWAPWPTPGGGVFRACQLPCSRHHRRL